jgi:uncharacterized protein (TIGR02246 family)
MRGTRLALAVSIAALGLGVTSASAQTKDAAMDKLAADWTVAFNRGDAKAVASFYTENAVRINQDGGKVAGRAAIEKEFAANFQGPFKGTKIKINVGATTPVGPDVAVNEGTWEVTGAMTPDGKPAPPFKGSYLNTIVKKNGAWVLASNAGVPPQPVK